MNYQNIFLKRNFIIVNFWAIQVLNSPNYQKVLILTIENCMKINKNNIL